MSSKEIGEKQREILGWLCRYGSWYEHCGWLYGNHSKTINLLDSLVKRGLATTEVRKRGTLKAITIYKPTDYAHSLIAPTLVEPPAQPSPA